MENSTVAGMAATTKDDHVPDEARRWWWWYTFTNGVTVDEQVGEEEPEVDSDCYLEQVAEEEKNAVVAASESDGKMTTAAHARVEDQSSGAAAAARDGHEEQVSEDGIVQTQGGFLLGRKRKAIAMQRKQETTGTEIYDNNGQVECLRADNEMLRLQLVCKTKELEAEQILRLNLELQLKNKEIDFLKKQNEDLRAENEHYTKTAKPSRNPRLCRFCNEYVVGHDYRNCPKRRASASSEQDEDDDSS